MAKADGKGLTRPVGSAISKWRTVSKKSLSSITATRSTQNVQLVEGNFFYSNRNKVNDGCFNGESPIDLTDSVNTITDGGNEDLSVNTTHNVLPSDLFIMSSSGGKDNSNLAEKDGDLEVNVDSTMKGKDAKMMGGKLDLYTVAMDDKGDVNLNVQDMAMVGGSAMCNVEEEKVQDSNLVPRWDRVGIGNDKTDGISWFSRTDGFIKSVIMVRGDLRSSISLKCGFSEDTELDVGLCGTPLEEQSIGVMCKSRWKNSHGLQVSKMWTIYADVNIVGCKLHQKSRCVNWCQARMPDLKDFNRAAIEAEIGDADTGVQVDFDTELDVRTQWGGEVFCSGTKLSSLCASGSMKFAKEESVRQLCLMSVLYVGYRGAHAGWMGIGCEPGGCTYLMNLA